MFDPSNKSGEIKFELRSSVCVDRNRRPARRRCTRTEPKPPEPETRSSRSDRKGASGAEPSRMFERDLQVTLEPGATNDSFLTPICCCSNCLSYLLTALHSCCHSFVHRVSSQTVNTSIFCCRFPFFLRTRRKQEITYLESTSLFGRS